MTTISAQSNIFPLTSHPHKQFAVLLAVDISHQLGFFYKNSTISCLSQRVVAVS